MSTSRVLGQLDLLACHWALGLRASGQTTAMRRGLDASPDSLLLAHNVSYGRNLVGASASAPSGRVVTLDSLNRLRGVTRPLLADHYVMGLLLADAARTIRELEAQGKISDSGRE